MMNLESLAWQMRHLNPYKMEKLPAWGPRTTRTCDFSKEAAKADKKKLRDYREALAASLAANPIYVVTTMKRPAKRGRDEPATAPVLSREELRKRWKEKKKQGPAPDESE